MEGGGWAGLRRVMGEKWGQLHLNKNKERKQEREIGLGYNFLNDVLVC